MLKRFTNAAIIVCALLLATSAAMPSPQAAQAAAEKLPKDQAEYELATKTIAETDAKTKIQLLNEWKEKYPESDYKEDQLRLLMRTHQSIGDSSAAINAAKDVLAQYPNDFEANFIITSITPATGSTSADVLSTGETAATSLISGGKPATLTDEQWNSIKAQILTTSHQTLGWIHMQRKDNVKAEGEFKTVLGMNPANGQVSYWLGRVVLDQGDPDKNELALFSFARACAYTGEAALPAEGRQQVCDYLSNVYEKYAGTQDGLDKLKATAVTQALPPAGLVIESASVREFKAEQARRAAEPKVYAFMDLRDNLLGPTGDNTWSNLQGKKIPKGIALYVLSADSDRPTVLNLGSKPGGPVEVVLNLENRLRARPSGKVEFDGVASSLTKSPFKLVLTDGTVVD